jgi:hypothetical protein
LSAFQGAFFLMKKALNSIPSVYTNSENAIAGKRVKTWLPALKSIETVHHAAPESSANTLWAYPFAGSIGTQDRCRRRGSGQYKKSLTHPAVRQAFLRLAVYFPSEPVVFPLTP